MATTSSTSAASFNGASTYAAQLNAVITNAVTMASAPINQLETQQTTLTNQQAELQTLTGNFQSLQSAIDSLNTASGVGSYSASLSNNAVATASVSAGVMPGIYSINVISLGSQTNTMSNAGGGSGSATVSDPTSQNIDSSQNYTLTVNGQNYNITGATSLEQLAQAINTSGASVQATVVNVGGSSSPDYRLSVQSLNYAPDTIQLSDNGSNTALLSTIGSVGSAVQYQVNGQSTTVSSNTRNLTLSTGLSLTLQATGSTTINVGQDLSGVSSALSSFVSAYNTALNEVSNNRGQNGGALSGQAVVYELSNALQSVANYAGTSGTVTSLAAMGVTFTENGQLSFDASAFAQLAATSPSSITNFLGSETGSGFLQNAENVLQSVTAPATGILPQATSSIATEVSNISTQISDDQARVSQLQSTLTSQMAAADATLSSLENQVSEMTTLFSDMQTYTYSNAH